MAKTEAGHKNGAGAHNWGSMAQEEQYVALASADVAEEFEDYPGALPILSNSRKDGMMGKVNEKKGDVDVDTETETVATSPSDSMSSVSDAGEGKIGNAGMRRMSNVSVEEREKARVYREGVLHHASGSVDLAHIAKTSYGIAQVQTGIEGFSTSPNKTKGYLKQ
ncbi:hypothetical protein M231_00175 [Tremella mesenterica]|uniref:Hyaluronan/mRNA-binding protein domain-containing protein n=1 Tax=Tremella mesenterica TaxID=5217 RepID=A0A4Q1BWR3_TREME|nr:hypothetical protein M231_00175 [Tremella mesenterica]